jgi:hypothetical protein
VAFTATVDDGTKGIFSGSGGTLATIFKVGDPAPIGTFTSFDEDISIGTAGKVTFLASYDAGNKSAIFTSDGEDLTTVAKIGDIVPGLGAITSLRDPSMSDDEVAFYATWAGDEGFLSRNAEEPIQLIASKRQLFPTANATGPHNISMGRLGFSGNRLAFSFYLNVHSGDYIGVIGIRAVPEPATLSIVGLAVLAAIGCVRRRSTVDVRKLPPMTRSGSRGCQFGHVLGCSAALIALAAPPAHAQTLEWVRQFGTTQPETGLGISADGLGNVYITGSAGDAIGFFVEDAFLSKYDAAGQHQWTQYIATEQPEIANAVSADGLGNVYITGWSRGFFGASSADAYLSKYDATGALQWTRLFGSDRFDTGIGVSADSIGNVYVLGNTHGSPTAEQIHFVTKYDSEGAQQWTRQFASGVRISSDGLGNAYVVGQSGNASHLNKYDTAGNLEWTQQLGSAGPVSADSLGNVFLSSPLRKFDAAGNLVWAKDDGGGSVSADGLGNVFLSGHVDTGGPTRYVYVSKYDGAGTLQWTTPLEIDQRGNGSGISADGLGNVYIGGSIFVSPAEPPGPVPHGPDFDPFVAKFNDCPDCEPPPIPPVVLDATLGGEIHPGSLVTHQFTTSFGDTPVTWSNPISIRATINPPTLSETGLFSWQTSKLDVGGLYQFDVTATNEGGSDTGRLTLRLAIIPEPSALLLVSLGICIPLLVTRVRD